MEEIRISEHFKSGFVHVIGLPNVGKSSLINAFLKDKLLITSPKPQTTRQRILGILNEEDYQIVFSDSPGFVKQSHYKLHKLMNEAIQSGKEDSDVILYITDIYTSVDIPDEMLKLMEQSAAPKILLINKIDQATDLRLQQLKDEWSLFPIFNSCYFISAKTGQHVDSVFDYIKEQIPEHPPYFSTEESSDKSIRFFISEIIRQKIFLLYKDEIPYSSEVVINGCKGIDAKADKAVIDATIFVERKSQQAIIIGKEGKKIKQLGIDSRLQLEKFLDQSVFLDLNVKIKEGWRNNDQFLKHLNLKQ